jgi:hypothetical protein
MADRLTIQNFAQLASVELEFADLTVLVGAQGTGKSIALQWLKTALDHRKILEALADAGHPTKKLDVVLDLIFGAGMGAAWTAESRVEWNGVTVDPLARATKARDAEPEHLFFIPAHRSMLISDGWAMPFQKLNTDTPIVARLFSQNLFERFSSRDAGTVFPLRKTLKEVYRDEIERAVFHGGEIAIEEDQQHRKRLRLSHGKMHLPFMTWTAGQREFAPLLMGLYHLLPSQQKAKLPDVDWVVIEEPEMGLHPQAITVVVLLILDLLWRGYRVVLSTHSPHLLTAVWMLQRLKDMKARPQLLCEGLGVRVTKEMKEVAEKALTKDYKVHLLEFSADKKVRAQDISRLDPGAEDDRESGWGGLTGFSSRFGDAVRQAANEAASEAPSGQ